MINQLEGEETGTRTLGISHLHEAALYTLWTGEAPLLVCAASKYIQGPMKHPSFHASSFEKSGKGLLRELRGLY